MRWKNDLTLKNLTPLVPRDPLFKKGEGENRGPEMVRRKFASLSVTLSFLKERVARDERGEVSG